jgi:hypothetical protein
MKRKPRLSLLIQVVAIVRGNFIPKLGDWDGDFRELIKMQGPCMQRPYKYHLDVKAS